MGAIESFTTSCAFVILAEMGDKTQLLAMCFAARYRWQTVMWAVFVATAANHFLAVVAGAYLARFMPAPYVQGAACVSFILFGLWTIKGDSLSCEDKPSRFSPFWTVAIAFFLAETGDKTQLATAALAAKYNTILTVWLGTTTGMIIADAIGILVGTVMGKNISQGAIKWTAALIFIAFGLIGLYGVLPGNYRRVSLIVPAVFLVALSAYLVERMNTKAGTITE